MIYNGLELGSFFEIPWTSPCYQVLRGINPILQMVFTFSQMYFVFMNARVSDIWICQNWNKKQCLCIFRSVQFCCFCLVKTKVCCTNNMLKNVLLYHHIQKFDVALPLIWNSIYLVKHRWRFISMELLNEALRSPNHKTCFSFALKYLVGPKT